MIITNLDKNVINICKINYCNKITEYTTDKKSNININNKRHTNDKYSAAFNDNKYNRNLSLETLKKIT